MRNNIFWSVEFPNSISEGGTRESSERYYTPRRSAQYFGNILVVSCKGGNNILFSNNSRISHSSTSKITILRDTGIFRSLVDICSFKLRIVVEDVEFQQPKMVGEKNNLSF